MPQTLPPKRIALFIPSYRGGGAERAMMLFAEGLLEQGFAVDFLVAQTQGPLRKFVPAAARLIEFKTRMVSLSLPSVIRYLKTERPDALYATIVNANLVAIVAKLISRSKTTIIIRESNVLNPSGPQTLRRRLSMFLTPTLYRFADGIISVSDDVAVSLREALPSLEKRIRVLPNPVITTRMFALAEDPPPHPWFNEKVPVIVGAGRLHPQKDFASLIRAVAALRRRREVRLLILGEGEEREELEHLIDELGMRSSIALCGFIENPFPFFQRASVFVLSSRYEGMPNVLLQAMAFGTPVVATDCHSGAREVLRGQDFGRLVPVGDIPAIAAAIEESIASPKNHAAAAFVKDRYSVRGATEQYLQAAGISI